jgi:hypothetical protein
MDEDGDRSASKEAGGAGMGDTHTEANGSGMSSYNGGERKEAK